MLADKLNNEELKRAFIATWPIWGDCNSVYVNSPFMSMEGRRCEWIEDYVSDINSIPKEILKFVVGDLPLYNLSIDDLCVV